MITVAKKKQTVGFWGTVNLYLYLFVLGVVIVLPIAWMWLNMHRFTRIQTTEERDFLLRQQGIEPPPKAPEHPAVAEFGADRVLVGEDAYGKKDRLTSFFAQQWDQDTYRGRVEMAYELFRLVRFVKVETNSLRSGLIRQASIWRVQRNEYDRGTAPENVFVSDPEWPELMQWWEKGGRVQAIPSLWEELPDVYPRFTDYARSGDRNTDPQERAIVWDHARRAGVEGLGLVFDPEARNADGTKGRFNLDAPVGEFSPIGQLERLRKMAKILVAN